VWQYRQPAGAQSLASASTYRPRTILSPTSRLPSSSPPRTAARARATDTLHEREAAGATAASESIKSPSVLALGTSAHSPPQRHPFSSSQYALQTDGYQQVGWNTDLADAPAPTLHYHSRDAGEQPQRGQSGQRGPAAGQGPACAVAAYKSVYHLLYHCYVARQPKVSEQAHRKPTMSAAGADWAVASGAPAVGRLCEGQRARQEANYERSWSRFGRWPVAHRL